MKTICSGEMIPFWQKLRLLNVIFRTQIPNMKTHTHYTEYNVNIMLIRGKENISGWTSVLRFQILWMIWTKWRRSASEHLNKCLDWSWTLDSSSSFYATLVSISSRRFLSQNPAEKRMIVIRAASHTMSSISPALLMTTDAVPPPVPGHKEETIHEDFYSSWASV